ncbi:MAG: bifunctional phosphoglucose/phosphomannose isomerase [Candidatus Wildermuthbacteria bacterium]|nr:bifunctional phosphoglucose/phosphomannose isomerase [Candidatus Wildermuthbacteria bacterium]
MEQAIRNFAKQFEWEPKIENEDKLQRSGKYLVCGMGGSHLAGDIFQTVANGFDLSVHQDYDLPSWPDETLKKTLIIASSYSGNTEETISAFEEAVNRGYPAAAIAVGGKLIELAKKHGVPYIQMPDTGIQPRSALGFSFKALAKLIGREDLLREAGELAFVLRPDDFENPGKQLAEMLIKKIPVIYASNKNYSIAYNWKIKFNETGKIPAFYNVLPELNHNEMTGFSARGGSASGGDVKELSHNFSFIILRDISDPPKIQKRMEILEKLYDNRGLQVIVVPLNGSSVLQKIFSSLLLADWAAYYTAKNYGLEAEQVPMVEEFKRLML